MDVTSKRVLVTGGSGFLGRHVVAASSVTAAAHRRRAKGWHDHAEAGVVRLFEETRPTPSSISPPSSASAPTADRRGVYYQNVMMGALTMEQALSRA